MTHNKHNRYGRVKLLLAPTPYTSQSLEEARSSNLHQIRQLEDTPKTGFRQQS